MDQDVVILKGRSCPLWKASPDYVEKHKDDYGNIIRANCGNCLYGGVENEKCQRESELLKLKMDL